MKKNKQFNKFFDKIINIINKRRYNYYKEIKNKTNEIYHKFNLVEYIKKDNNGRYDSLLETVVKEKLYNLILNICNQIIYDYNYVFSKDDLYFIEKFEIDKIFDYIVEFIIEDVVRMKRSGLVTI